MDRLDDRDITSTDVAPACPGTEARVPAPGVAVRLEDVSIRYRVPHERIPSIKEYVIRRLRGHLTYEDFWALSDITLDIQRGEVFGVIGRNGAGKSTLLRVLAHVLRPHRGRVLTRGHLVPLLDIGAGFHPDLTGIENIFLNAAILGHTRAETRLKIPSILDFADITPFIDAPIRTYSMGMTARLAFAVSTAWDPEILLIDEVLSVGDEAFQRKCHERIDSFRRRGATVVIVSHDASILQVMCTSMLWLDRGRMRFQGASADTVNAYHQFLS